MAAIAVIHKTAICEQLAAGYRLSDIAAGLGISQPAISKALKDDAEFKTARELACESRIEQWETALQQIGPDDSPVMLARARELLSHARWRAEREYPERFGQRTMAVTLHAVTIAPDMLESAAELLRKAYSQTVQLESNVLNSND